MMPPSQQSKIPDEDLQWIDGVAISLIAALVTFQGKEVLNDPKHLARVAYKSAFQIFQVRSEIIGTVEQGYDA